MTTARQLDIFAPLPGELCLCLVGELKGKLVQIDALGEGSQGESVCWVREPGSIDGLVRAFEWNLHRLGGLCQCRDCAPRA